MRRLALSAMFLMLCASAPVAQEQELSPEADKAMWCGAAFSVMQQAASEAEAAALGEKADAAFAKAAAELIPTGMTVEAFGALAEDYAGRVAAPFRTAGFTQAECEELVAG